MVFSRSFRQLAIATLLFGVGQFGYFYPTSAAFFQGAVSSSIAPSISCSYTPVTSGTQGTAYTGATPSASGGTPSYTFSQTGTLPGGLTISSSTGIISGTPSASGSFPSIQVKVTDSASNVANCGSAFTLAISSSTCPQGTAIADGCSGAQAIGHGTIVNANLATPQQVIALNIVKGSGYTPGTYTWTSSGGGCSPNASGTITVANGISGLTIAAGGTGYTANTTFDIVASGGAGSGFTGGIRTNGSGVFTSDAIGLPGINYTSTPTLSISSSGGGTGASVTANGITGYLQQTTYTISNPGAGCTSRPTIAVPAGAGAGSGGSIIPTVYQVTPHNCGSNSTCNTALGANFNVPGVDYPIGVDTTLTLSDPTAGGLPTGAAFSGHTVTISGNNVTLNGWDFSLHGTKLQVNSGVTNPTITNNKFACVKGTTTDQESVNFSGGSFGTATFEFNTLLGGALPQEGCFTGGMTANVNVGSANGTFNFKYNLCENADSKCLNFAGTATGTLAINEQFNYYWNFGLCGGGCSHGEAEYSFGSSLGVSQILSPWINQHNVMLSDFANNGSNLTAPLAIVADGMNITSPDVEFNMALGQGPQSYTGSGNPDQLSTSSAIFAGHQENGVMTSGTLKNNFIDYSGGFDPYNGSGSTGAGDFPGTADFNAGSGNGCNWTTCN